MDAASLEDQDLAMASRESAMHATSVQNEAYRQALSELAGELYVEAYKDSMQVALRKYAAQWKLSGSNGSGDAS